MKQVLLGDRIIVSDVPAPGVDPGSVLVENTYSFISSGTESAPVKKAYAGLIDKVAAHVNHLPRVIESIRINGVRKTFLRVSDHLGKRTGRLGYSSAGRVVEVGDRVNDIAQGDLVACAGMGFATHSEVISVPRNLVAKLPIGCNQRSASGATIASIALQGVRRAELRLGETAAIVGLGLLGQITLQLLRVSGVAAIGFDTNPWRVKRAREAGFVDCHVLNGAEAVKAVMLSCQNGVDATLITAATSAEGICQTAIEMTRRKGRVVVVGDVPLQFDRDPFYRKEIDFLISCSYGPGRYDPDYEIAGHDYPYEYVRWTENRNMQAVLQMITSGKLDMSLLIDAEYPISEAEEAFGLLTKDDEQRPLGIVLSYECSDRPAPSEKFAQKIMLSRVNMGHGGKVSLGVIGVGQFFQKTHLPNLVDMSDRYHLIALCSRTGSVVQDLGRRCGAVAVYTDPAELLKNVDIEAIMICTQHDTHAGLVKDALLAGKHVFVEKPLAINQEELDDLIETCLKADTYLMTGFNRRFSPHAEMLSKALRLRKSPLNVLYRVYADRAPLNSWIYSAAGRGRVIGECCHMLDFLNYLVGDDYGVAELDVVSSPSTERLPAGDNFSATIRYEDGSVCTLVYTTLGRRPPGNGKERIEAMWDDNTCLIDDFKRIEGLSEALTDRHTQKGHREELQRFADYITGNGQEPMSLAAMIKATELSFKIDKLCHSAS